MKTNRLILAAALLTAMLITVIACRKGVDHSSGIDRIALNGICYREGDPACNIAAYGATGGYIEGTFNGMVKLQHIANAEPVPVTGSFRIKRFY
jgi:hypothetical protein